MSQPGYNHQYASPYYPNPSTTHLDEEQAPSDYYAHSTNQLFAQSDFVGQDESSLRQPTYPPTSANSFDGYEKGVNPVTRGSIAAQMAAEGQIPKKAGLRMWRADEHAGALMKGGRARCCGRVCCCMIILVVIILVGIISAFLLWVRPPDITFNGIEAPTNGSEVAVQTNGFLINFNLNIGVVNPNFFGADFSEIQATAFYPTNKTVAVGGGVLKNVKIPKNSNDTIHFPFTVNYTTAIDPGLKIAYDIATKCGFIGGGATEDLTVDYTIKLGLKIAGIVVWPSFSSSTSFECPLSESDVEGFLGGSGLSSLTNLGSSLGKRTPTMVSPQLLGESYWKMIKRWAESKAVINL